MAKTTIAHRRKVRELEARRDRLMEGSQKNKTELAKTRAELSTLRKQGAKQSWLSHDITLRRAETIQRQR